MRKARICLVVDNPLRDLEGMVLLGWTLARKGAEVFLVPMYHQVFEVAALRPDLVLVNYLRTNNKELVKAYSKCGILVGILDTEGGIFSNVEEDFTNLVAGCEASNVDLYCLWGRRQYDSFIEHGILPKEKLYITGCPRHDFCAEPWKSTLPCLGENDEPIILVNTRFSLIFPRFQRGLKDEINMMLKVGFKDPYVREYARQCFLVWAEMINVVADLAKFFSKAVFVVRPHPFENRKIYEQIFKDIPNIKIIQEGTVLPWINSSLLLIQRDCSTAVEASFLDVEPVSLGWIDAPMLNNEVIFTVSHHAKSREHLFDIVENTLKGNPISPTLEMKKQRKQVVNDWFYAIDGKSSERVADAILETFERGANKHPKQNSAKILMYNASTKERLKNFVNFLGCRMLGIDKYDHLKSHILRKPRAISKKFSLIDVQTIVNHISKVVSNSKVVSVESLKNEHTYLKMLARYSIRLSL